MAKVLMKESAAPKSKAQRSPLQVLLAKTKHVMRFGPPLQREALIACVDELYRASVRERRHLKT